MTSDRPGAETPDVAPAPDGEDRDRLPAGVADPATRPDADTFLPPLDGYTTEEVDAGELEESLAHGPVPEWLEDLARATVAAVAAA